MPAPHTKFLIVPYSQNLRLVFALLFHGASHRGKCSLYFGQRRGHGGHEKPCGAVNGMCPRNLMGCLSALHGIGPAATVAMKVNEARYQEQVLAMSFEGLDRRNNAIAPRHPTGRPSPVVKDIADYCTGPRHVSVSLRQVGHPTRG